MLDVVKDVGVNMEYIKNSESKRVAHKKKVLNYMNGIHKNIEENNAVLQKVSDNISLEYNADSIDTISYKPGDE